ncbi:thymidylate kinase [Candidatus Gracilibacteria bacterium]|nr:thymidylate kinase [Candidatus Gracilibacteria bacterium]
MFIVLEGIDGSGKGTQIKLLKEKLELAGKKVKLIDYPRYGKKGAVFVEKYLNGKYGKDVSAKTASLFYALDRFDSSFKLKKEYKKYDYILANRYVSSNMVHQAGKIKGKDEKKRLKKIDNFLDWLIELEFDILEIPIPDKVIFLDVKPLVANKLVEKKEKRAYIKGDKNKDLHEEDENHIKDAYNTAIYIAKKYDWTVIDCVKNDEILEKEIITEMILKEILP